MTRHAFDARQRSGDSADSAQEVGSADRQNVPSSRSREPLPQLSLGYLPGNVRYRERDGELVQITPPAWTKHRRELVHVLFTLAVVEQVVKPGVDNRAEGLP